MKGPYTAYVELGEHHVAPEATFAVAFFCVAIALLGWRRRLRPRPFSRGTSELNLSGKGTKDTAAKVDFLATKLHTQLLRFDVRWYKLEPQRNGYDETYLAQLAKTIHAAAGDGLQVIVTIYGTPKWASDQSLWGYVPAGYKAGVYRNFYPPSLSHLDDYQAFANKLATTFGSDVLGYECYNEPNAWFSLYPQRTSSDAAFGVRRYAAMLTAFSKGIRTGDPEALVIAGGTAPTGSNNTLGTSPQRFATELKSMVKLSVFDAYSHHPYTVGGTSNTAPEALPRYPNLTVSLGNISTLLKIFPTKPFYITEYGYYTVYRMAFGIYVNQVTQALYLPRAYKFVTRYPQIKALIWYPYQDSGLANPPANNSGRVLGPGDHHRHLQALLVRLCRRQQADSQGDQAEPHLAAPGRCTELCFIGRPARQEPGALPQDAGPCVAHPAQPSHGHQGLLACDRQADHGQDLVQGRLAGRDAQSGTHRQEVAER